MTSLSMNLVKRVDRLPKPQRASEAMQPLFEAISNSIHSTQQRFGAKVASRGRIIVEVETDRAKSAVSATVSDNGVGLDQTNFDSFVTTDTDNKIAIGGKGVGRLLWLDCFRQIHVESIYATDAGLRRRSFDFRLTAAEQIANYKSSAVRAQSTETGMAVRFSELRDNGYLEKFPGRSTYVFQHFMSHFLPTFIGGRSPMVSLTCGGETREFPAAISEIILRRADVEQTTKEYGCVRMTDRARHPSGSSIGPSEACGLAALPPQKNVGTPPHPKEFHRTVVAGRAGANLRMACGAGDPLPPQLVTAIRRPIQCSWLQPQSPYLARRIVVVLQAKQRVTSNGLPSFRM